MARGNTDLSSNDYDQHLASKNTRESRIELKQRHRDRKNAHKPDGTGWHFGLGDTPVKVNTKEELRKELHRRGLMLEVDVKKNLR